MIDKNKIYNTRDGREVRIYAMDGCGGLIHGAVLMKNGWDSCTWYSNGKYCSDDAHDYDLIEVKPKIKGWVNIYRNDMVGGLHRSRKEADSQIGCPNRIACIEIEFAEGDGI